MQSTMNTTSNMLSSAAVANVISALAKVQQNVLGDAKADDFHGVKTILASVITDTGLSYIQRSHSFSNQMGIETVVLHTSGEFLSSGVISLYVKDDVEQSAFVSAFNALRGLSLATAFGINYQTSPIAAGVVQIVATQGASTVAVVVADEPLDASPVVSGNAQAVTEAKTAVEASCAVEPTAVAEAAAPAEPASQQVSPATAIVDINGQALTAEEIASDAAELVTKTTFLATLTDIARLENAKVRANDFFKATMNIAAFKLAIEERIKELKQPVQNAG